MKLYWSHDTGPTIVIRIVLVFKLIAVLGTLNVVHMSGRETDTYWSYGLHVIGHLSNRSST